MLMPITEVAEGNSKDLGFEIDSDALEGTFGSNKYKRQTH